MYIIEPILYKATPYHLLFSQNSSNAEPLSFYKLARYLLYRHPLDNMVYELQYKGFTVVCGSLPLHLLIV